MECTVKGFSALRSSHDYINLNSATEDLCLFVGINSCCGVIIRAENEESRGEMEETPHCTSHLNIQGDKTPQRSSGGSSAQGREGLQPPQKLSLGSILLIMAINYLGCYSNN